MPAERSGMVALVYAQAGVQAIATVNVISRHFIAVGSAGFDPVQSECPNQITPLKCNKHVDLLLI